MFDARASGDESALWGARDHHRPGVVTVARVADPGTARKARRNRAETAQPPK